jgi:hypothetical protein
MEKPLDRSRDHPDSVAYHGGANDIQNGPKNLFLQLQKSLHVALTGISVRLGTDNNDEESTMDFLKNLAPHVHWGLRLYLAAKGNDA